MLFEDFQGNIVPLLPHSGDGSPRIPDGVQLLNLHQAAKHFSKSVELLRGLWTATWGKLIEPPAAPEKVVAELPPELADAPAADAAASRLVQSKLDVLKVVEYPHLSDEQFQFLIEYCRQRRINPFTRQIAARIGTDEKGKPKLDIITTISTFRSIGHRNGCHSETAPQWAGRDEVWKEIWTSDEPPYVARVGVCRLGETTPLWGIAYWTICAQYQRDPQTGDVTPTEFWDKGPAHMLGKCAVAAAYRVAGPDDLGGLYTFDEMMQQNGPRPPGSRRPAADAGAIPDRADDVLMDDSTPTTWQSFQRDLTNLNFNTQAQRDMLVRQFDVKFPGLRNGHPMRFFALVIQTVRANPQAYGAEGDDDAAAA